MSWISIQLIFLMFAVVDVCFGRFDKADEQRMWPHRPRQELRVELAAYHKGVILDFRNLNQLSVGRHS